MGRAMARRHGRQQGARRSASAVPSLPSRRCTRPLPEHRHIPGTNPRHPEGAFDAVRSLADDVTASATATGNAAWLYGLDLLEAGFYWESHEVLEPVWMNAPPNSAERHLVQAVIQLANAGLKQVMGRDRAALRLCRICDDLLDRIGEAGPDLIMGLEIVAVRTAIARLRRDVEAGRIGEVRTLI